MRSVFTLFRKDRGRKYGIRLREVLDPELDQAALEYHQREPAGKTGIKTTKSLNSVSDLSLAYSPGVAAPCREIAQRPSKSFDYTNRGNLVAIVSNGTAVLGLGPIGAEASKPVMEGKAALLKTFSGIDAFDLEVDESDPLRFAETVISLAPTFGGIILEDIRAPDCYLIEDMCREQMSIPVMHDDQHGTAICVAVAIRNSLLLAKKKLCNVRIVCSGAGAGAIASLDLLVRLGARRRNILLLDSKGVVHSGRRRHLNREKIRYARRTKLRKLEHALEGADIFLGLSAPNVLEAVWLSKMSRSPIILALANPTPEVKPEDATALRADAIVATGRSDYPNQVNNVLCFPFIFRGALDTRAASISPAMQVAAVDAIAELAHEPAPNALASLYPDEDLLFGPTYILPKPLDARLLSKVSTAVARAAMRDGSAKHQIADLDGYSKSHTG